MVDALNLWVDRTIGENHINADLFRREKDKIKKGAT